MYKGLIFVCLLSTAACGSKEVDENNGEFNNVNTNNGTTSGTTASNNGNSNNGMTANNNTTNNNSTGTTGGTTGGTTNNGELAWTAVGGPCPGSRTASILFTDANTGLIGCGENAMGEGLFLTEDGGDTWTGIRDLADIRVNDIRLHNGNIFIAGADNGGGSGESVWKLDADYKRTTPPLYVRSNSAFTSVQQAQNIAIGTDGRAVIDSLTGAQVAVRGPNEDVFTEVSTLNENALTDPDAASIEFSRIDFFENKIYATGSQINNNAKVYLASKDPAATYHVTRVDMPGGDAEMYDLHVFSETSMIVVGTSQSGTAANRSPLIFLGDGDLYDAANWEEIDVFDQGIEYAGWIRAISVVGQNILAVGEKIPTSQGGFAMLSTDAGKTWKDVSPAEKLKPLSEVYLWANGTAFIGGGGGAAYKLSGLK